jgi:uncharacterized protein (DUF427 family)
LFQAAAAQVPKPRQHPVISAYFSIVRRSMMSHTIWNLAMNPPDPDPILHGQESVWSFPRPSIAQPIRNHLRVVLAGRTIAETHRGVRTIETSHPPTYYFPPQDVAPDALRRAVGSSFCEWKGSAIYYDVIGEDLCRPKAAWSYPEPSPPFGIIRDHVAFYAAAMDACFVDDEAVLPQPGNFYGGWITSSVAGPFKGVPGSRFW